MKKVFLSGPVTDHDYEVVKKRFNDAEKELLDQGYQVVNPVSLVPAGTEWYEAMNLCIEQLHKCDVIYFLNGWFYSRGSVYELDVATGMGLERMFQDKKLNDLINDKER